MRRAYAIAAIISFGALFVALAGFLQDRTADQWKEMVGIIGGVLVFQLVYVGAICSAGWVVRKTGTKVRSSPRMRGVLEAVKGVVVPGQTSGGGPNAARIVERVLVRSTRIACAGALCYAAIVLTSSWGNIGSIPFSHMTLDLLAQGLGKIALLLGVFRLALFIAFGESS